MHFPFQQKQQYTTISSYIQSLENFSNSQQGPPWFSATPRWPSPPPLPPPRRRWNLGNRRNRGGVWRSQRSRDLRRSKPDSFVGLIGVVNGAMNKNLGCLRRFVGDYILSSLGSTYGLVGLIGLFDWFVFFLLIGLLFTFCTIRFFLLPYKKDQKRERWSWWWWFAKFCSVSWSQTNINTIKIRST